jgi:SRSO17 transposase
MQHLLARAKWDADGVRDDTRGYVIEHLGDPGAVLVIDETGDIKKGTATPGVQRQYTGTAGRIENAQVAVYLGYAAPRGHALIDRELYLPRSWTDDQGRCAAVPFAWVAGDEVYGGNGPLRAWLEARRIAYVLAVACDHRVPAGAGHTIRADQLASRLPGKAWQRLSAGAGAKGHRWYDWAWVTISDPGPGHRHLLIRRNRHTRELAFYRCYSPRPVPLPILARIAGTRWTTEENFQAGKQLTGLDEHQVRTWTSWHRWVTLAMLAAAALTIAAASEHAHGLRPSDQIPLTRNEIAHLLSGTTIRPARDDSHRMRWSRWRRRHQHRARTCHYQRQTAEDHGT